MVEFFNFAQIIIGPAGSGKSTYCKIMQEHAATLKRTIKVINLDPAAETFNYTCDIDIRDLITVKDVMEKLKYGPNGALIYCLEYLFKKIDWLEDKINEYGENAYFLIDCPGQLELYSHYNVIKLLANNLKKIGVNVCSVFCLDSTFLQEQSKFVSGSVLSLASMIQLELPHMTILTKCDLIEDKSILEEINNLDPKAIAADINPYMGKKMEKLNEALVSLLDNFSLVEFFPLDYQNEESVNAILYHSDSVLQYYDNQEPKEEYYQNIENSYGRNDEGNLDHGNYSEDMI